ncbi:FAD-dependent oxidoreductase [Pseudoduganella aquatica]|uniref:FAD-dependent oxidoreductase n=1 Tax=Pseudoduganella aquatica TaxID=2660641 RepID=UPI001E30DE49|nr:FAD-dependent oxidoreductase [Pseudoduganella aquatica]
MIARIDTEIAVIGASLGGVLAAWQAAQQGRRVLLAAEYAWLGGQLTSQGVPPDEHPLIESGGASASYMAMRTALRAHYLAQPGFRDNTAMTEGCNPGDGWVSRLCVEPAVAAEYIEQLLAPHIASGRMRILRGVRLCSAQRAGRTIVSATVIDGEGLRTDIHAPWFLDGTDTGALIKAAGLPYRLGKEARSEFGEPDAPETADRNDQQPVTVVMALRREASASAAAAEAPPGYAFWSRYLVPHYGYAQFSEYIPGSGRGQAVRLPLFGSGATLDLWRYRRVVSAANWQPPRSEVSLVNWAQNDYALHPLLDGGMDEADVVAAARELSLCLLHWLRTEAPRPDGGAGYPELALAPDVLATPDGLAQQVYVRESRRIIGLACLSQADILPGGATATPGSDADSHNVGVAWYNMDIHPTVVSGHGVNARVRPFELPLGSFIPADCNNLIPACKNISVTHLVNACTRVHPAEWLIGEVAGLLAVFALGCGQPLAAIHGSAELRAAFRQQLRAAGIPLEWDRALLARLPDIQH